MREEWMSDFKLKLWGKIMNNTYTYTNNYWKIYLWEKSVNL